MLLMITTNLALDDYILDLLSQLGYSCICSQGTVVEVLHLLSIQQIKVILLPANNGLYHEHWALFKALEPYANLPCIFYTTPLGTTIIEDIKKLPCPVYWVRSYHKEDWYIALELACYKQKFSETGLGIRNRKLC